MSEEESKRAANSISMASLQKGQLVTREQMELLSAECNRCKPQARLIGDIDEDSDIRMMCINPETFIESDAAFYQCDFDLFEVTRVQVVDRKDLSQDAGRQNNEPKILNLSEVGQLNYKDLNHTQKRVYDHYANSAKIVALFVEDLQSAVLDCYDLLYPILLDSEAEEKLNVDPQTAKYHTTYREFKTAKNDLDKLLERFDKKFDLFGETTELSEPIATSIAQNNAPPPQLNAPAVFAAAGQIRAAISHLFNVMNKFNNGELVSDLTVCFAGVNGVLDKIHSVISASNLDYRLFAFASKKGEGDELSEASRRTDKFLNPDRSKKEPATRLPGKLQHLANDLKYKSRQFSADETIKEAEHVAAQAKEQLILLAHAIIGTMGTYLDNLDLILADCDMSESTYERFINDKSNLENEVFSQNELPDNEKDLDALFYCFYNLSSRTNTPTKYFAEQNINFARLLEKNKLMVDYLGNVYEGYCDAMQLPNKYKARKFITDNKKLCLLAYDECFKLFSLQNLEEDNGVTREECQAFAKAIEASGMSEDILGREISSMSKRDCDEIFFGSEL